MTPLHTAAKLGDAKIVEMLLKNGASVSCRSFDGKTPLHYAVKSRFLSSICLLVTTSKSIKFPYCMSLLLHFIPIAVGKILFSCDTYQMNGSVLGRNFALGIGPIGQWSTQSRHTLISRGNLLCLRFDHFPYSQNNLELSEKAMIKFYFVSSCYFFHFLLGDAP